MSAPTHREFQERASVPVRRQRRNLLRRHWMSGALLFSVLGVMGYTGTNLYRAQLRLQQVSSTRAELEVRLLEERRRNETLTSQLTKVTSDPYMEKLAKEMGFVYPGESVYQHGAGKGQ
jgi:cell division protein FtsB